MVLRRVPVQGLGRHPRNLGIAAGEKVVYFPRRSYDMWNTRYFILPKYPHNWLDESRGYASFLHETEEIYPPPDRFQGPDGEAELKDWVQTHDYQIRRNRQMFPRAWVVHDATGLPPMDGLTRAERSGPMQEILYGDDPIWHDPTLPVYDPHRLVWIADEERLAPAKIPGRGTAQADREGQGHLPWSAAG